MKISLRHILFFGAVVFGFEAAVVVAFGLGLVADDVVLGLVEVVFGAVVFPFTAALVFDAAGFGFDAAAFVFEPDGFGFEAVVLGFDVLGVGFGVWETPVKARRPVKKMVAKNFIIQL